MRILVAVDQHPYSAHVVKDVAKLAGNTWADVTLLGVKIIAETFLTILKKKSRLMKKGRVTMNSSRLRGEYGKSCISVEEPGKI
jgi:K+-sensing histidine kinase KdpD